MAAAAAPPESSAANINSESKLANIFADLENVEDRQLKSVFLPEPGQPSTSDCLSLQCTYQLLLQVYKLKIEHSKSWDIIVKKLHHMFPVYPKNKFRALIEKVVREAEACSAECRKEFYARIVDLNSIGQFADAAGVNRTSLNEPDVQPLPTECFSHGLLLELEKYADGIEHLWAIVQLLMPQVFDTKKSLREQVKKIKGEYQKRNKSKCKGNKAQEYLHEQISFAKTPAIKQTVSQVNTLGQGKKVNSKQKPRESQAKQLKDSPEQLQVCKDKLEAFQEMCLEKEQRLKVLQLETQKQKNLLEKQDLILRKTQATVHSLKNTVLEKTQELKSVKRGNLYQRIQRKKKYFKEREKKLQQQLKELDPHKVKQLRQNLRNVQKNLSCQKHVKDVLREENKRQRTELREFKLRLEELESEVLFLKDASKFATRYDNQQFTLEVEKCVMELATECEISAQKCSKVIQTVIRNLFHHDISMRDLPSESTVVNMVDRAHVLAKYQVAEQMSESDKWDYHFDGTTRDNRKILGQQVTLSSGKSLSVGFVGMVEEDSATLVDNAMAMISELADLYDGNHHDMLVKDFLRKMCATMSDRASVNKCFARKFAEIRQSELNMEIETHMLFCNAHFLLGLSNESEKLLKCFEKSLEESSGQRLGRSNSAKFAHFRSGGESSTGRYVRTASDVFGPRGDEKNGCRSDWLAYCAGVVKVKSRVSSFRMNRFNNFFAGAASLYFHQSNIQEFLSSYKENLNLKLESVKLDCMCGNLQALVRALGILFFKVTGPYWNLLHADVEYVDLHKYVQRMHQQLGLWTQDVTSLLDKDSPCVFPEFSPDKDRDQQVYDSIFIQVSTDEQKVTETAVKKLVEGFIQVTERQLSDFLPGGEYGTEPTVERRNKLRHCKLTNLLGENAFGDLDFSQFKRRNASVHYHSGIHMVKCNRTISNWLSKKPNEDQVKLVQIAHENSIGLRKKHREHEAQIILKRKEKLELNQQKIHEKRAAKLAARETLLAGIKEHGGPCKCPSDVERVVRGLSKSEQTKVLKLEMQYQKNILNKKDKLLLVTRKSPAELAENLKLFLGNQQPHNDLAAMDVESDQVLDVLCSEDELCESDEEMETASDDDENEIGCFGSYKFKSHGEYIAVAYEQDFHIGMVTSVKSEQCSTVQFLQKGYKGSYRWPSSILIDDIESKFVFCGNVELTSPNNGRTWSLLNSDKIQKLYNSYCKQYF